MGDIHTIYPLGEVGGQQNMINGRVFVWGIDLAIAIGIPKSGESFRPFGANEAALVKSSFAFIRVKTSNYLENIRNRCAVDMIKAVRFPIVVIKVSQDHKGKPFVL